MLEEHALYAEVLLAAAADDARAALRGLKALRRRYPRAAVYAAMLADEHLKRSAFAPAARLYQETLRLLDRQGGRRPAPCGRRLPSEAVVRTALADALAGAGAEAAARAELLRAAELDPTAERYVSAGQAFERVGRVREARAWYLRALRLDRRDVEAQVHLATLDLWARPARAARRYRRVLVEDPRHGEALCCLGLLLLQAGSLSDAERLLRRAARYREDALPHVYLGHLAEERGRPDEAVACFLRAEKRDPGSAHPLYARGDLERRRGRYDEARAAYEEALRLEPRSGDAAFRMGLLFEEAYDDPRGALSWIRRGLAATPHHPWAGWLEREVIPELQDAVRRGGSSTGPSGSSGPSGASGPSGSAGPSGPSGSSPPAPAESPEPPGAAGLRRPPRTPPEARRAAAPPTGGPVQEEKPGPP